MYSNVINDTLTHDGTELVSSTEISEVLSKRYSIRFSYSLDIDFAQHFEGTIKEINIDIVGMYKRIKN